MAFALILGSVSASLTANNIEVSVEQGLIGTDALLLTAADNVSGVSLESNTLTGPGFLADALITFNLDNFNISEGESQEVIVSVDSDSVALGIYAGTVTVKYFNGSAQSFDVPITVEVTQSTLGAHLGLPESINFGEITREEESLRDFVISNTGSVAINDIQYALPSMGSDWIVNLTNAPSSLAVGASQTVTMKIIAPDDADAEQFIGTLTVSGTSSEGVISKAVSIFAEPENYLEINDITVTVTHRNGDSEDEDELEDGDTVKEDVFPGDEIEIEIKVENNNNDDVDFDDGVEVIIENDDELDVDEDDEQDIKEGDKETYTFTFTVDNDADDGDQDLDITVVGTDDNGAEHKIEWTITFTVDKESDDIGINSIDFPSTVRCGENARLEIEIENYGTDDQDEAELRVEFPEWDLVEYERDIQIDEGDDDLIVFNIAIPEDAREGSSYLEVEAFYARGSNKKTDDGSFDFKVVCSTSDEEDDNSDNGIVIVPGDNAETDPTAGNSGTTPTGNIVAVGQPSFFESTGYIVLLTGLVVLLIVVIIAMLLMGNKK